MDKITFFEAKIAFTKGFAEKKLDLGKINQLYKEVYGSKASPSHHGGPINKNINMSVLLHKGETSIYKDEGMDRLLGRYGSPTDFENSKPDNDRQVSKTTANHPILQRAYTLTKQKTLNLSEQVIVPQEQEELEEEEKQEKQAPSVKIIADPVEKLKKNINKYNVIISKIRHKTDDKIQKYNEQTIIKNDHFDTDAYIKGFLRRVGLENQRTALEDLEYFVRTVRKADKIDSLSLDKPYNIFGKNTSNPTSTERLPMDVASPPNEKQSKEGIDVKNVEVNPKQNTTPLAKLLSLPKIRQNFSNNLANQSQIYQKKRFLSETEFNNIFESCSKVKENIQIIDKKLAKNNKKISKNLSNLQARLGKVMKVNFLPKEYILGDDI